MITINGAQGEGGGQIFRSALTLSMCLGKAVTVTQIRQGRTKPGLMRQHLACVNAAAEICDAKVNGAHLGSQEITFEPGDIKAGNYRFAIGSAGSTCLLFQTLLPALARSGHVSELILEGGTHCSFSPSFDFIRHAYLPQLEKMGYRVEVNIDSYGFYPVGGGRWTAKIYPLTQTEASFDLTELGSVMMHEGLAISSRIAKHVSERELQHLQKRSKWSYDRLEHQAVNSPGAGNVVSLRTHFKQHTAVCESIGTLGVSAERVAGRAVQAMSELLKAEVPVCEHLADQLLLPMALGYGGRFMSVEPSQHTKTHCEVIAMLTQRQVSMQQVNKHAWLLEL